DFALILDTPSISERIGRNHAALAQIQAQQQSLKAELRKRSIPVTGSASTLVNAVFVRVPANRARELQTELQSTPGVQLVVYLPPLRRHLNGALDLVQASGAWSQIGGVGNAGAGIKIAIIDSGIAQNHPGMQDASLQAPAGFPVGDKNFTNSKVIVAR